MLDARTLRAVYRFWERATTTKQVDEWLRAELMKAGGGDECIYGFHPATRVCRRCSAPVCEQHVPMHEGDHV